MKVRLTALLAVLFLGSCSEPALERPNVILIVIDTLRADRMSSYGYQRATSPRLDQLASEGTLFEDVTSQASWTLPSMVSLLTGRYNTNARSDISKSSPSIAQALRRSGYTTVGLVANPSMTRQAGFSRGFDLYIKDDRRARPGEDSSGVPAPRMSPPIADIADIGVLEAIERELWVALERAQGFEDAADKPLFLYLHPFDPHKPYSEHERYEDQLPVAEAQETEPLALDAWHKEQLRSAALTASKGDPNWNRSLEHIARERAAYDQEVRYADDVLGRIFDGLRERGLLENAVVVIASDHGEGLWDHLSGRPAEEATTPELYFYQEHGGHLYQEATRTPILMWGQGVPAGLRVDSAVQNIDIYPTLLELAEVPLRTELHGLSLVNVMLGGAESAHEIVYSNAQHKGTIRDVASGLKLTVLHDTPRARNHRSELFDLNADPLEREDLLARQPADVERLQQLFSSWQARFADPDAQASERDPEQEAILRELGYTGFDLGGAED